MTPEQIAEREIRLLEEIKQDLQGRIDRIRESMKPASKDGFIERCPPLFGKKNKEPLTDYGMFKASPIEIYYKDDDGTETRVS